MPNAYMPPALLQDINSAVLRHKFKVLAVYAEAEIIRRQWRHQNIALEDIVDELVRRSAIYRVAIALDPAEATAALLGTISASRPHTRSGEVRRPRGAHGSRLH